VGCGAAPLRGSVGRPGETSVRSKEGLEIPSI
jgi:hypothetical protein